MKNNALITCVVLTLTLLSSFSYSQHIILPTKTFDFDSIQFVSGYATSRLSEVAYNSKTKEFELSIHPEFPELNSSPWYGFEIQKENQSSMKLRLSFEGYNARYAPKISRDKVNWTAFEDYKMEGKFLEITLPPGSETIWISGNNPVSSKMAYSWMDSVNTSDKRVSLETIGLSSEGNPINRMIIGNPKLDKVIMILGRQHPPEVTGYFGLRAFIDENLNGDKKFKKFLKEYSLVIYPLMNPDGVDRGNWRFNASDSAMDMNRDWGIFSQPETSQVYEDFDNLVNTHDSEIVFSLDFHSTFYDILYLVTEEEGTLSKQFLDKFNEGAGTSKYSVNSVDNGVYKNWFYNHYDIESITYEMGDDTSFDLINKKGRLTANILKEIMP
ncbi:M14 family metallopeptidase [Algoriphagus chordae]|uniref:Zinc carboxypeptidase n=1 Tax=Algoriphagus chordae TaxID=237019 RepID=A0A2W7QWM6_9BACT|nr:M14 family metallopeptidase [Algoriphagus chordae]PZX52684.1 zinc carboxypeptidase [Algoriphagus chordae]